MGFLQFNQGLGEKNGHTSGGEGGDGYCWRRMIFQDVMQLINGASFCGLRVD
jgi:hypothetical protein